MNSRRRGTGWAKKKKKRETEQRTREYNKIILLLYLAKSNINLPMCASCFGSRLFQMHWIYRVYVIDISLAPFTAMIIIQDRVAAAHKGSALDRALKKIPRAIWIEDLSFLLFPFHSSPHSFPLFSFHRDFHPFSSIKKPSITVKYREEKGRKYIYIRVKWK